MPLVEVVIFVGDTIRWLPELIPIAQRLVVGAPSDPTTDLGPLISRAAKIRVENAIAQAEMDGATILLDGRNVKVPGYPDGNFVGPTILTNVRTYMSCYQEEVLGPLLICLHVNNLDEAIALVNENICRYCSWMKHQRPQS